MTGNPERTAKGKKIELGVTEGHRGLVRREYRCTELTSAGYRRLGVEPPAYVRGDEPNFEREPPAADAVATFIREEL